MKAAESPPPPHPFTNLNLLQASKKGIDIQYKYVYLQTHKEKNR